MVRAVLARGIRPVLVLLLAFSMVVFLDVTGHAGQAKKVTKASKSVKKTPIEQPPPVRMELEPKAMDIIKASCSRLAAARSMRFTAVVTYENPSRLGTPLAYTTKSEVTLQRPDKLRVITLGDGPASEFYYNGKNMVAFAPAENLVAVADAPPTIEAALKVAYDSAAIYFPFTDLIVADPYKDITDGLILAFYIGQSKVVGGTTTDMVAYANNDVFVQAWIGVEDKLPRMVRAVYRADLARKRNQLELSDWQLDGSVPSDAFASKNAPGAKPIAFAHPNAKLPPYAKPSVEGHTVRRASEEVQHIMKKIFFGFLSLSIVFLSYHPAWPWGHANSFGGGSAHSFGGSAHSNAWGGSTEHTVGETSHTSAYGTSTTHAAGEGTAHTNVYGGSAAHAEGGGWAKTGAYGGAAYGDAHTGGAYYHPPAAYYPYHPPATVNVYGAGCYNCGGWSTAGAAAAGAAVGMVVGATAASANTAAATSAAYSAGVAAGASYVMGADLRHATCRLRSAGCPGCDLLPVRQ